jgi:hypothetical protein
VGGRGFYSREREKKSERNRVDKFEKITASSGEFIGRRLTTTSVLMCGPHLLAKKKKGEDTDSGGGAGWAVGHFLILGRSDASGLLSLF